MIWYSHLFKFSTVCCDPHKDFNVVSEADFFLKFSCLFYDPSVQFSSVQSLSHVRLFATLWTAAHQASLSIYQLLELAQTHAHQVGDAIQPSHPLSSPSPAFNLSQHQGLFQ